MYRDVSYLIIKQIENKNLGIEMKSIILGLKEHGVLVSFVDNTDLFSDGNEIKEKMQSILNIYNKYYKATGGEIEEKKTTYYSQKWNWKQGQKIIKEREVKLMINDNEIKAAKIDTCEKTLGVCIRP